MTDVRPTIAELGRRLAAGEVSSRALTEDCLARVEQGDGELNSFITTSPDAALAAADAADARIAAGDAGPLTGIPFAHKDIFCTLGTRTTCGSRMLEDFVPPYDATVVIATGRRRHCLCRQDQHGRVRNGLVE